MTQPDNVVQEPDAAFDDDYYKPEDAYYNMEAADDQE